MSGVEVPLVMQNNNMTMDDGNSQCYTVKSAKLVKFRETKLEAIKFTQSGSKGKLMITFDQSRGPVIRFHKIKGLRELQKFDFSTNEPLDYKFSDIIETTRIELKDSQPKEDDTLKMSK